MLINLILGEIHFLTFWRCLFEGDAFIRENTVKLNMISFSETSTFAFKKNAAFRDFYKPVSEVYLFISVFDKFVHILFTLIKRKGGNSPLLLYEIVALISDRYTK